MYKNSPEQQLIIDHIPTMVGDSSIFSAAIAFAGCGKSSTLKMGVKSYPQYKFLVLSFGHSNAEENKATFPKRNSSCYTLHEFARIYLAKFNILNDFTNAIPKFQPIELFEILDIKDSGNYALVKAISSVMKIFCQSDLKVITCDGIREAADLQLNEDLINVDDYMLSVAIEYTKKLWTLHVKNKIPPTFDFYLKLFEVLELAKRITDFDILFIDEAQDSNFVTYSIAKQLPCPILAVGDPHQSIYGFRGTLNLLSLASNIFYLSYTYRYVPKIADFATKILATYKGESRAIKSLANRTKPDKNAVTAFLSRNNSSMIAFIAQLLEKNIRFKTVKKPEELFDAAKAILEFRLEGKTDSKTYRSLNRFKCIEELVDYIEESNDSELKTAFSMQRMYGKRLYYLLKEAQKNFKSKEECNIVLCTAHTSKGLEWDYVELLNDFPDITRLLKEAKIQNSKELMNRVHNRDLVACNIIQEINLYYVAVTRARFNVSNRTIEIIEPEDSNED